MDEMRRSARTMREARVRRTATDARFKDKVPRANTFLHRMLAVVEQSPLMWGKRVKGAGGVQRGPFATRA